jgi:signal transduction histidine kinase
MRAESGPAESDAHDLSPSVPGGRILLVEPSAETSAYLRGLLDAHWEVETVESGLDALEVVRTRPPDILLTNATPAAVYGVTLLRELRSKPATRDLPVLMYSDRVDEASLEAFEEGVDDYLIEPFTARELLARVSGAIKLARMRADVSKARAEAQVASAREALVKIAAHELRTPLTVIGGYVSMLRDGSLPSGSERAKAALALIARKTEEAKRMVNQMLLAARIDAKGIIREETTFDLRGTVADAVERAAAQAEMESQELVMTLPEQPIVVRADRAHLGLILDNLINNAVVHGRGGITEIALTADPPTIRVTDHGRGVPPEARNRIFDPFFQVQGQVNGRGGVGLGLAVSRQLAELEGGSLILEPAQPGVGSCFRLTLPESAPETS